MQGNFVSSYTYEDLESVDKEWPQVVRELNETRKSQGLGRLSYSDWQWRHKYHFLGPGARIVGLQVDGVPEGLIDIKLPIEEPESPPILGLHAQHSGEPLVYIEHVQSAPWNSKRLCTELGRPVRYRGVGEALIEFAVMASLEAGCDGRVILFSLPEAESFYDVIGMYRLGRERLLGNCMRYEFTADAAEAFIRRQNRRRNHA